MVGIIGGSPYQQNNIGQTQAQNNGLQVRQNKDIDEQKPKENVPQSSKAAAAGSQETDTRNNQQGRNVVNSAGAESYASNTPRGSIVDISV